MKLDHLLKLIPALLLAIGVLSGCGGDSHEGHDHGDGDDDGGAATNEPGN